jgi:hypothetical protein
MERLNIVEAVLSILQKRDSPKSLTDLTVSLHPPRDGSRYCREMAQAFPASNCSVVLRTPVVFDCVIAYNLLNLKNSKILTQLLEGSHSRGVPKLPPW